MTPVNSQYNNGSHASLHSETGMSSSDWTGSDYGGRPSHFALTAAVPPTQIPPLTWTSIPDESFPQINTFKSSAPSSPFLTHNPMSPLATSMSGLGFLDDAPVIPDFNKNGASLNITTEVSLLGHTRSSSLQASPHGPAPPSPIGINFATLPDNNDYGYVSPSDTSPSTSPYLDQPYGFGTSSSPHNLSPVETFDQLEGDQGQYPSNLSSNWNLAGSPSGLGISIPNSSHHRHSSLEVPPMSGPGPVRHGHSSSIGSMSETDSNRSRSGSMSRGIIPSLSRRHTSASRPGVNVGHNPAGISRHRTVSGASIHQHAHSHSLGSLPSSSYSRSPMHSPLQHFSPLSSAGPSPAHHSVSLPQGVDPSQIQQQPAQHPEVKKTTVGSAAIESAAQDRRTEGRVIKHKCDICERGFTAKHNLTSMFLLAVQSSTP
ncbi:hypothetical protein DL96DRAFT_1619495 [Flagelloscypha sp. PMI_526]|nr:hypothetical protein DL96DRAFT_1619495 [Flagelloscypha sp. PMI_526]